MEEATVFERIAIIDAEAIALMTERDLLIAGREELLREVELRRQMGCVGYG